MKRTKFSDEQIINAIKRKGWGKDRRFMPRTRNKSGHILLVEG